MKLVESAVWTLLDSEHALSAPSTPLEYEESHNDNARALKAMEDSVWALVCSAELQCAEADVPSLTAPDYEDLQKENRCALNELQQLENEIDAEKRAGEEDKIQMEFDVGNKLLDESDHLMAEADFLKTEMAINQQETAFEVIMANIANMVQDGKRCSKQWQDEFEEEIGEEVLHAFAMEDILQVETEEVQKECDQLCSHAKKLREESDCIQSLTHRRAKELLRGVDALKAESAQRRAMKAPDKMQRAKAMVQREARNFLKAKSEHCFAKGRRRSPPKNKQPSSKVSCHQPALPVLLGRAGFLVSGRDIPPYDNPAKGSKKEVCGSAR